MMDGFAGDMLSGGRALLGEDSSVMARMQKKFWKTKQVLIKATGKKEDECVVASDADLDAKLEFFRSVQSTCTELLKVIERYQQRITRLSQEENELGLFLRFQSEHDRSKAGNMMGATSKALCTSAKQRMALCAPLHRLHQEVETFRRRAIADTLLTVGRMEKARTEYRGALLWMKDVSQELDPDTYKQLEKFRKVQAQVRGTKGQFEKLKNDVCQKVDMLGASRCNMLSHSLCTYQTTLLHFWERTAHTMSAIHDTFRGHVQYQFTTLKDLRDPLEKMSESKSQEDEKEEGAAQGNAHSLVSLDDDCQPLEGIEPGPGAWSQATDSAAQTQLPLLPPDLRGLAAASAVAPVADDLLLLGGAALVPTSLPQELWDFGGPSQLAAIGVSQPEEEEDEGDRGDMAFLKDLLSPGPGAADDFSQEWHDAFGMFESPAATTAGAPAGGAAAPAAAPPRPPSPGPSGFLPSQLLDHSLSATGWATPPMFQAPSLQSAPGSQSQSAQPAPGPPAKGASGGTTKDMSAWFNLFADLDPLSNPDAIGRSADELLNA